MNVVENKPEKQLPQIKIVVFGSNKSKQLILDHEIIENPEIVNVECDCIKTISCGLLHTQICLCDGNILCIGDNSKMQFGKKSQKSHFEKLNSFKNQMFSFVACGNYFSVALTKKGSLYTWGSNNANQLGRGLNKDVGKIEIVSSLSNYSIIQVACGDSHCIALSKDSILFSWGDNKFGQLGLGINNLFVTTPEIIASLECLPIKQISCGDFHSIVLTPSGSVYTWGSNTYGQIGTEITGTEESYYSNPIFLKSIKNIQIVFICSGNNHNALLTLDGGLFTFGDGRYGQLGHGNLENQFSPRKVADLMGSTITQISCGDFFTLVFVNDTQRFYGFGKSDEGQLGLGIHKENIITPTKLVDFLFNSVLQKKVKTKRKSSVSDKLKLRRIYSGGSHTIILLTDDKFTTTDDLRDSNYSDCSHIAMINESVITEFSKSRDEISDDCTSIVYTTMGSLGCLSSSFLDISEKNCHFSKIKSSHGVDIDGAYEFQKKILLNFDESELEMLRIHMYENLFSLRKYQQNYPGIECLRAFLILMISPLLNNILWYETITVPVLIAVNSFSTVPRKYMDSWLTKLKPRYFKKIVETVTNLIKYNVMLLDPGKQNKIPEKSQIQLAASFDFLKILYVINEKCKLIAYNLFYIPTINDKIDIEKNFIEWATANSQFTSSFSFCSYPFVFDAKAKAKLLQVEAGLFMRNAVLETHTNLIMSILNAQENGIVNMETPFFEIGVNRKSVLQDTLKVLEKASQKEFKKPLKISFSNEEAVDDGGVVKEYFLLVIREIMLPKTGLFKCFSQSKLCYFQPRINDKDSIYKCVGQLCGLAIYNGVIVDLHFPLVLFKKLLEEPASLDDIIELDPVLGNSLQQLLDYNENDFKEVFELYHEISWEDLNSKTGTYEMMTNGKSIAVTNDNKEQYVIDYVHFFLNQNVSSGFDAFKIGFYLVCVGSVLKLFRPIELQELIVGSEITDWLELKNNAVYQGEYWKGHQVIIWFWEVFKEINQENKKRFLRFLTGCDRAPIAGMIDLKIIIQSTNGGDQFYPVAHTCYNLLDLPKYSTKKILKSKLIVAIGHTEGFTLV